jgi:hypothetical protein
MPLEYIFIFNIGCDKAFERLSSLKRELINGAHLYLDVKGYAA